MCAGDSEFREQIITKLVQQTKRIKELEHDLNQLAMAVEANKQISLQILEIVSGRSQTLETVSHEIDIYEKFPIKTIEDLEEIENDLMNLNNFGFLVKSLSRLGGNDYKECIRRILSRMVDDSVMSLYSLQGHKGKRVFSKTKLFSAVIGNNRVYL
ncbi:hypothetical protein NQ314_000043 [Rhamnusium bicolor]|uniref:DUF4806 domain-containing protein n=1 Tax=Rhamnusium bicolor TaxID=1586634 RepID=A0AAV8ZZF6_9CUCU|nr:hypothetical protein NQ314_000043 [Rhamnusium bicolor]